VKELVVYIVFSVFYLGAFINCAVVTADMAKLKALYMYLGNTYQLAVAATVTVFYYLGHLWRWYCFH